MNVCWLPSIATPLAILAGAGVAWAGNYHVQRRILRYIGLREGVADLKLRLHEFMDLSAAYWTLDSPRVEKHRVLEAQILAKKRIIQEEFIHLRSKSRRLRRVHEETVSFRLDLWSAATGGCFQESAWKSDPQRFTRVAAEASRIIRALNQAH